MRIIGFTGMPWSGKSEAVKIAKEKGISVFRMGDFVWNEVKKQDLPLNTDSIAKVAHGMRKKHGSTVWAKKTLQAIQAITTLKDLSFVVIDGIRSREEVTYFRSHLSDSFVLVAITAPTKLRHQRAKKRGRVDDSVDERKLKERDDREKKWGIEQVISAADFVISNKDSLEVFRKKVFGLFSDEKSV